MMLSVMTPNSSEALIKVLEARVAALEKALQVSASQVVLQSGAAKITLNLAGDVQITANNTNFTSAGNAQIKAGGNLILKAARITQS